jgi:DNA phosphorothioation-associated putative methyltransferase
VLVIDPLSDDPLVCSGSANFSKNSLTANEPYKMTSRASAGKNLARPASQGSALMSHCDFKAQLKSSLKAVGRHHYIHLDGFDLLPADATARLDAAESLAQITRGDRCNVARFDNSHDRVALLNYPSFFEDAFPALHESWNVDLTPGRVSYRNYRDSLTPPILHRKELMLPEDHPRRAEFQALTETAEAIGLFEDSTRIGFREQWLRLVREKGYQIVGHDLIPIANDEATDVTTGAPTNGGAVARHLTALVRYGFSAPVQALARYGLITPSIEVFDYGCGRGDDVRGLAANGIAAYGWDPHYAPDAHKREADIVNLGFVINVIENLEERIEALHGAYSLAKRVLAVAAMLASQAMQPGRPYRDGFVTSRNTFQKYYTQAELAGFISQVLNEEPIPVSPGVFFVFRDKDLEQNFLAGRHRSVTLLQRLERPEPVRVRLSRPERIQLKYDSNREIVDDLWRTWLRFGREPDKTEVNQLDSLIQAFGSLSRALRFTAELKDETLLTRARDSRIADLSVYLAIGQFAKRKPYKHLESGLQRDIRSFFGGYNTAQLHARQQLFKIADTEEINAACIAAAEQGLGWLATGHSLQLHTSLVERLPTVLRIYIACGAVLYGDIRNADLIKIHIGSGKLTLMKFDDFEGQPLPRMVRLHVRDHGLTLRIARIDQDRKARVSVQELMQKPELLCPKPHIHGGDTGDVTARSIEADDEAGLDRIGANRVYNRNGRGRGFGRESRSYAARCRDDGHLPAY